MIIDAFAVCQIPFIKANSRAQLSQVLRKFIAGKAHLIFRSHVGIETEDDLPVFPGNPIEVRNRTLNIQPLPVRACRLADDAAPVEHAGNAERQKARRLRI